MRVKSSVYTRQRKKKVFKIAKSYYSDRGRRWRQVKQQVERSLRFAYIHRRNKKREYRRLWIVRINAAARLGGLSYSRFMAVLKKNNIQLNRKSLAHLAVNDPKSFDQLLELAKASNN
ncbi:MAG: 50S ribosomal protein L20 [Elusimicrobia bacterium]|nr:50S ribosomal protein L20 [Elusimicrobiota bacterium]